MVASRPLPKRKAKERDIILANLENPQDYVDRCKSYFKRKIEVENLSPKEISDSVKYRESLIPKMDQRYPPDIGFYISLAVLYEKQEELDKATEILEKALQRQKCPDISLLLGSLYERQGLTEKTIQTYTEGIGNRKKAAVKLTPAICLRQLPEEGYNEFLVCGISRFDGRKEHVVDDFDEIIDPSKFPDTNLRYKSVIRLGYLSLVRKKDVHDILGYIPKVMHERLLKKLSGFTEP